jgi:hypothetical protein
MGITKFKQLNSKLAIGLDNTFFVIYDNERDADYRVSLRVLIDLISSGSLSDYVPLIGTNDITGALKNNTGFFQLGLSDDTSYLQFIDTLLTLKTEVGNYSAQTKHESLIDGRYTITVNDSGGAGRSRSLTVTSNSNAIFTGDVISYNTDRTARIDVVGNALITREYADAKYALVSGTGIIRVVINTPTNDTAGSDSMTDYVYFLTGSNTLTLPTAVGNTNRYLIARKSGSVVSIASTGGETFNGVTGPINLNVDKTQIELISDGSNWTY